MGNKIINPCDSTISNNLIGVINQYNQMNSLMSMSHLLPQATVRRSQRRRYKLADRNAKQHQIPNPYKDSQTVKVLPGKLRKQISKLEYLSYRALKDINYGQGVGCEDLADELLAMRMAACKQEAVMLRHLEALNARNQGSECESKGLQTTQAEIQLKQDQHSEGQDSAGPEESGSSIMADRYEEIELVFYSDHAINHMKEDYQHFLL